MSEKTCDVVIRDVPLHLKNQLKVRATLSNKTLKQFVVDQWAAACTETIIIDGNAAMKKAEGS